MDETIQELNWLLNKGLAGAPEGFILYTFWGVQKRNLAAQRASVSASYPPLGSLLTGTINSLGNLINQYNLTVKQLLSTVDTSLYAQLQANLATIQGNINTLTGALVPYASVATADVQAAIKTVQGWVSASQAETSAAISDLLGWASGL